MIIFTFVGIIASIFQLVLLREFTSSIAKNELSLVIAVGVWLVFCSLGSLLGRKKNIFSLRILPFIFSVIFCLALSSIHLIKPIMGINYYETVNFLFTLSSSFILIGSMSFLVGYSFGVFSEYFLCSCNRSAKIFASFFAFEAIGFFIGSVIFTFFLADYSNPFVFSFLPLLFLISYPYSKGIHKVYLIIAILILSTLSIFAFKPLLNKEFKTSEISLIKGSAYGLVVETQNEEVSSLFVNGNLLATSEDKIWNEEFLHTSLSSKNNIKEVLYIGPYFSGQAQTILKHDISHLDCIDINPVVSNLSKDNLKSIDRSKITFITDDPRSYIQTSSKKYDSIIMNISAPSTLAFNRYFSLEFFKLIKESLNTGGVFCFHIPSKRDILSPNILNFDSCIINTLDRVFDNRLLIPSDSMIILVSKDIPIKDENIINNFVRSKIRSNYLTRFHLKDLLDPGRRSYVENMLNKDIQINTDYSPRGFLYYLLLEQAKFYPNLSINVEKTAKYLLYIFSCLMVFLVLAMLFKKKKPLLLNASIVGFSSIGLTSLIFLLFQISSGALFWKMGIIIGSFMAGVSCAIFMMNYILEKYSPTSKALSIFYLLWTFFIISIFVSLKYTPERINSDFSFYLYSFFSGILTGTMYPLLSKILFTERRDAYKNISVTIYAMDLIGAFLGTFVFSILFIPFTGIFLSLGLLIVLAALFSIVNLK